VSFSVLSGPATISGSIITLTGAGTVTVRASQPGNDSYNAAPSVDQSFSVAKADQTITFGTLSSKALGDPPFVVSATSSSGLPITFSIATGPATIAGSTVTMTGVGAVVVRAAQAGNANYNAAPNADQIFTVGKGNQTITFGPLSGKVFGDSSFAVNATASSGLAITFSILSGPATIAGNTVSITGAGTVTVRASQVGNDNYNAAPNADQSFTVAKANQTITFGTLPPLISINAPFSITAAASSGLPVTFNVVSGPATIAGNVVTVTDAGLAVIRASQTGSDNYNAAPNVEQQLNVAKANQTITFPAPSTKTFGDTPFTITATASSSLSVSFSVVAGPATVIGNTVTITGAGNVRIRATQAGNDNFNAAPAAEQEFVVNKAAQTIAFGTLDPKTFGDSPFGIVATASSGLPVNFSLVSGPASIAGNTVTITGAGVVIIQAAQGGNENFSAAPNIDQPFTAAKANQTITFDPLPNKTFGDPAFNISAITSSRLPPSFSIVSGPATISEDTITMTAPGTVIIRAAQLGNENFNPAPNADQTLTVAPKVNQPPTISAIANQSTRENTPTARIVFTVADPDTALTSVTVTVSSSNAQLVPPANMSLEGQGADRTIAITPAPNQTGTTTITLTVKDDGTGEASTAFELTILAVPPQITTRPESRTIVAGGEVSFNVAATGSQPLTYQWRRNGSALPGATNAVLNLANVQVENAGVYSVEVRNQAGFVVSEGATLDVTLPLRITTQPESKTILAGANVTFTVAATGQEPLRYQWQFNRTDLAGETRTSLVLSNVNAARAGGYSVQVSNAGGATTSATATLVVHVPAAITRQPEAQTVVAGAGVRFAVEAAGTAPIRFQWQFNGVDITGETNSAFVLASAAPGDAGEYSVIVSNFGGQVVSARARLAVTVPPAITRQPQSQTVLAGVNVTFAVTVSGTEPITYQWRFNGANLAGATAQTLARNNVQTANQGAYSVVVSNPSGSVTSSPADLTVNVPAAITAQPAPRVATVGETASFSVTATGSAPITYQWRHNGVDIAGANASTLTIPNVQRINAGRYQAVASNIAGPVPSSEAPLTVNAPVTIVEQPEGQTVPEGNSAVFNVAASGTAPLSVQWQRNGVDIAGATSPSLSFSAVRAADAGTYRAIVRNVVGAVNSAGAILRVLVPPTIQVQPVSQNVQPGSTVAFSVQATGDASLSFQWQKNGVNMAGATFASLTLNNVQAADAGNYGVVVQNAGGAVTSAQASLTLILPQLNAGSSAQSAPPPIEVAEGTFDGGSIDGGGGQLARKNAAPSSERWFSWKAPSTGIATFSTAGSTFDTVMTIYTGTPGSLVEAGSDDDRAGFFASLVAFNATQGTTYLINVKGFGGASGRIVVGFKLQTTAQRLPRILVQPQSRTETVGAVVTFNVQAQGDNLSYQWLANGAVIGGATSSALTLRGVDDLDVAKYSVRITSGAGAAAPVLESLPAYLQIGSESISMQDKFKNAPRRAGGLLASALSGVPADGVARGFSGTLVFTTLESTTEQGEPSHGEVVGGASKWFTYQAPVNGVLRLSTAGSNFDSVIAVYSGPGNDFETLKAEGSDNNGASDGQNAVVNVPMRAGTLYFVAVDGVKGASGVARLSYEFGQGPAISLQPADLAVALGARATFSVETTNSLSSVTTTAPPLSYQWLRDGLKLPGATNRALTIASGQIADTAAYSVVVSSFAGSTTSRAAQLSVNVPLVITAQPQAQNVRAGSRASFAVSVSGTAPVRYQWSRNGTAISGATNAIYEIANAQAAQAGTYSVTAQNAAGAISSSDAALTVSQPPSITVPPAGLTVTSGQQAAFSVTATGTAPLTYQWRFNGVNIPEATARTFELSSAGVSDIGEYTVVVSNSLDSIVSSAARLQVNVQLVLTSAPQSQSVTAGSSVVFSVTANGSGLIRYQWKFNGNNMAGATNANLTLVNVQPAQAGLYSVIVSGAAKTIEAPPARLTVGSPPIITQQPISQSAAPGATVTLSVAALGNELFYQWLHNGTPIPGATNAALTLNNMQSQSAGNYAVAISNALGSVTSNPAAVTLQQFLSELRLNNGTFEFQLTVPEGKRARIDTSTDLLNWTPLRPDPLETGITLIQDNEAGSFSMRFYRVILE